MTFDLKNLSNMVADGLGTMNYFYFDETLRDWAFAILILLISGMSIRLGVSGVSFHWNTTSKWFNTRDLR